MKLKIEKLDHQGRGIAHTDGKIVFVENALPEEEVECKVLKETSKYLEASVSRYLEKSDRRIKSKCPFYESCGGCHLRHLSYDDTIEFKKNKLREILKKYADIEGDIEVVKNKNRDFYRNKIELQVEDGIYGFYQKGSHELVEVDRCINAEEAINTVLRSTDLLHISNGKVVIKSNYNGEVLLAIESEEEPNIEIERLREKVKLVGIIYNDRLLFGADHFIEIVDGILFKETYNSFFQVNRYITEKLFKIIRDNVEEDKTVLDMCSGVGTLSIVASSKASKVYSIEIVENAVKDAIVNARMNKIDNVHFMLGDAYSKIEKIDDKIDDIIIDPPRSGLNKKALDSILKLQPERIIYISCDPVTLSRDLKVLSSEYSVLKLYLLDMFSYTYHVESVVVMSKIHK